MLQIRKRTYNFCVQYESESVSDLWMACDCAIWGCDSIWANFQMSF